MRTIRMTRGMALETFQGIRGQELTVTDATAATLVALGNAVYLDSSAEPVRDVPSAVQSQTLVADDAPGTEDAEIASDLDEAGEPKRPYGNASKADWIHYALKVDPDLTAQAASDMSKVQLLQAYGERL